MDLILRAISDSGVPGYMIVMMGFVALVLVFERTKVLFMDYNIKTEAFMKQVKSLIMNEQIEEAITFCAANQKAPLPHVIKGVLERSDRDDDGIYQGLDIALTEIIPNLGKRLGYLAMIGNVATLLGLLGTITGLIQSFSAVSVADPAEKQVVLSQGISMAMNTTAMGLTVAIPVIMAYAFLHSRQSALLEEVTEHATKVVDILTTRHYQPFSKEGAFPSDLSKDKLASNSGGPPPTNVKAG